MGTEWEDAPLETKKELVKQACAEAFADEFIDRLPEVSKKKPELHPMNLHHGHEAVAVLTYQNIDI